MDDVAAVVVDLRVGNLDAFNEDPGVVDGERAPHGADVEAEVEGGRRDLDGGAGGELRVRVVAQGDVLQEEAAARARGAPVEGEVGSRKDGDRPVPPRERL